MCKRIKYIYENIRHGIIISFFAVASILLLLLCGCRQENLTIQPDYNEDSANSLVSAPIPVIGDRTGTGLIEYYVQDNFYITNYHKDRVSIFENNEILEVAMKPFRGELSCGGNRFKVRFDYALYENNFTYRDEGSDIYYELTLLDSDKKLCVINVFNAKTEEEIIPVSDSYILDLENVEFWTLVDQKGHDRLISEHDGITGSLVWALAGGISPDGEKIIFYTNRDTYAEGRYDYYVLDLASMEEYKIELPAAFFEDAEKHWLTSKPDCYWWFDNDTIIFDYIYSGLNEGGDVVQYRQYLLHTVSERTTTVAETSRIKEEPNGSDIVTGCIYAISKQENTYTFFNRLNGEKVLFEETFSNDNKQVSYRFLDRNRYCVFFISDKGESFAETILIVDLEKRRSYFTDTSLLGQYILGYNIMTVYHRNNELIAALIDSEARFGTEVIRIPLK